MFGTASESQSEILELEDDTPILDSICVDASTIENPGVTEYCGVDTRTKQILFQHKYDEATNNIGEFLAIAHALALYKKQGKELKVIIATVPMQSLGLNKKSAKRNTRRQKATLNYLMTFKEQ